MESWRRRTAPRKTDELTDSSGRRNALAAAEARAGINSTMNTRNIRSRLRRVEAARAARPKGKQRIIVTYQDSDRTILSTSDSGPADACDEDTLDIHVRYVQKPYPD
jgi:hypothetical protein